jgi:hypothetical protein
MMGSNLRPASRPDCRSDTYRGLLAGSGSTRGGLFFQGSKRWTTILTDTSVWSAVVHAVDPVTIFAGGTDGLYQLRDNQINKVLLTT